MAPCAGIVRMWWPPGPHAKCERTSGSRLAQSEDFAGIYWLEYGWAAPGEEVSTGSGRVRRLVRLVS